MVVTDAVWEKRNLGMDTIEVLFEETDRLGDIHTEFENLYAQYIVVKVPSDRSDLTEYVQTKGYHYIEDLIHVEHDLHEVTRNRLHQRMYDACTYRKMTGLDIQFLYEEIKTGMFDTDRISQDSMFSKEMAAGRYLNWTKDLIADGAAPYTILYKEEPAGFIILQTKDQVTYRSVLGGGYRKFRKSGTGIVQKEQEIVRKLGGKKVVTSVSSNNLSQLKALMINGYVPVGIEHIFVKHNI